MTNLDKNGTRSDMNEEVLTKVNGGIEISEMSDLVLQQWIKDYGQSDGSFKFTCTNCPKVITDGYLGSFYDKVCEHIQTHNKFPGFGNIPFFGDTDIHD